MPVGIFQSTEGLNVTKGGGRVISCSPRSWDIHLPPIWPSELWLLGLQPQSRTYTAGSAGLQAFGLGLKYTTAFPGLRAGRWQTVVFVSTIHTHIHTHTQDFLTNTAFYHYKKNTLEPQTLVTTATHTCLS